MELSRTIETETGEMIVKRVSVPLGLEELMEGLAKEVILKKPKDIYIFAADYFSRLLRLRDSGLYRGNVRSAKLAVRRPFRATVIGHNVLSSSESKDNPKTRQRKTPPQKIEKHTNNTNENRRAIIQNHLRKKQDAETKQKQTQMQDTKPVTVRSKLPTRSRSLSKSSSDKSGENSEKGESDRSSSRKNSSGKGDIIKQTKISPRSRSTSVSSGTRELKEKKRMEAIKEKNSNICGTDKLNKKNITKSSSADVEVIGESESRNIRRSLSVTQDKNGHYEVLYRPTPLPTGQRESTDVVSEESNNSINTNRTPVDESVISDQNKGTDQQSETTPVNDEVKSAIAIQAMWRGRQDRKKIKRQMTGDIENSTILLDKNPSQQEQFDESHPSENNPQDRPASVHKNEHENNESEIGNLIASSEITEESKEASKDLENKLSVSDDEKSIQRLHIETEEKSNEESDIMEGEEGEKISDQHTGDDEKDTHSQVVEDHQEKEKMKLKEGQDIDKNDGKSKTKEQEDEGNEEDKIEKSYHRSDTIEVSSGVTPKKIDVSDRDTLLDINSSAFNEEDSSNLSGSVSLQSKPTIEEEEAKNSQDDNKIVSPDSNATNMENNEEPIESPRENGSQEKSQGIEENTASINDHISIDTYTKETKDDTIGIQKMSSPTQSPKQTYILESQDNNSVAHEEPTIMSGESSLHSVESIARENIENSSNENNNISLHTNMAIPDNSEESKEIESQEKEEQMINTNEKNEAIESSINEHNDNISKDEKEHDIEHRNFSSEVKNEEIEGALPSSEILNQSDDSIEHQSDDKMTSHTAGAIEKTDEKIVDEDCSALEIPLKNEEDIRKTEFKKKRSQSHKVPKSESVEEKGFGNLRKVHSEDYEKSETCTKRSIPSPETVSSVANDEQIGYDTVDHSAPVISDTKLDETSKQEDETDKENNISLDSEQTKSINTNEEKNQRHENETENNCETIETEIKHAENNSNIADKDDNIENVQSENSSESVKELSDRNSTEINVAKNESHEIEDLIVKEKDIENIQSEKPPEALRNSVLKTDESSDKSNTENSPNTSEFDNDESKNNIEKASGEETTEYSEKDASRDSKEGNKLTENISEQIESTENYDNENNMQSKNSSSKTDNADNKVDQPSENDIKSTGELINAQENSPVKLTISELGSAADSPDLSPENDSKSSHESTTDQENNKKSEVSNIGCLSITSDHVDNGANVPVKEESDQKQSEKSDSSNPENSNEENSDEWNGKQKNLESNENNERTENKQSELQRESDVQSSVIDIGPPGESLTMQENSTQLDASGSSASLSSVDEKSGIIDNAIKEEKRERESESVEEGKSENSNSMDKNEDEMLKTGNTAGSTIAEDNSKGKSDILEFSSNHSDSVDGSLQDDGKNEQEKEERVADNSKNNHDISERESVIRIQTIWRGFQARKHLKQLLEQKAKDLDPHNKLTEKLSGDSITDENENLPETKNNNLSGANEMISNDDANNIVTKYANNEGSEASEVQNGGIHTSDEIAAAVEIQSAFRKSRRQRKNSESESISKQDTNKYTSNDKDINKEGKNEIIEDTNEKLENLNDTQPSQSDELRPADAYSNEEIGAAMKIQSSFRKSRKLVKSEEDNKKQSDTSIEKTEVDKKKFQTPENSLEIPHSKEAENFTADEIKAATKIQSTFRKSRKQRSKPKLEDMDLNSDLGKQYLREVLKIQSAWRAYRVRKNIRDVEKKINSMENLSGSHIKKSIHLSDQEILKAVTKIQAGLRGYLTRKHFNNIRDRNEALDGIKEESQSDYSRTNSNSSTDEHLLEILKKVEGAIIPDTVPEVPSNKDSTSNKEHEEGNKNLQSHQAKSDSSEEDTVKHRMKREIAYQNSLSTDCPSQDCKNTTEDQKEIERDNEIPPDQSLKDTNSEDGKNLQLSKEEQEVTADTKLHDDDANSRTIEGDVELEKAIDNPDGISEGVKAVSAVQLKHDSEEKDAPNPNETPETNEIRSTDNKNSSEGNEQQSEKNERNTPPSNEEKNEKIDDISEKPEQKEAVQPLSSLNNMTDHATESHELENTAPENILNDKDDKPSDGNETSESDSVGSHRGTLKKTKAIDNLVELAEQFEGNNESPKEKIDSIEKVDLKDDSENNPAVINIDDVEPGKKLALFEIPDDFEPDSLEVGRTNQNLDTDDAVHNTDGKESRQVSATNSVPSSEVDELTPRSEEPPSTKSVIDVTHPEDTKRQSSTSNEEVNEKSEKSLENQKTDDHISTSFDESSNAKENFHGTTESTNIKNNSTIKSDDSSNDQNNKNKKPTLTDFMKKTLDLEQPSSPYKKIDNIGRDEKPAVSNETDKLLKVPKRSRYESATKIQSIFRGYQARKFVESLRASRDSTQISKNPDISILKGEINNSNEKAAISKISDPEIQESLHGHDESTMKDSNIQGTQTNNVEASGNVNVDGSQVPGVENLTTETQQRPTDVGEAPCDVDIDAQTSVSDANTQDTLSNKPGVESECEMESTKRNNSTLRNKNMEAEAATKIQAGFRGYKVRKQLKMKNTSSEENTKKTVRRKSSSCLTENQAKKQKENIDLQEKSAVKIQAGIRGFLVRKKVKKPQKLQE
ncbi:putative uncharacterized protein DDB_G0282133 isoform X2 [Harmonia axyridis]|uniref:putative uncharacterized protein DDB_G0282133 isoform X2 n=1 Tax=Harmonia axyridis TaxID=115357 RepID=UPI001E278E6C|nr:putative uncharacterized protein DDB_G0282133 isoform X2 [Harmonia axyridis]